MKVFTATFFRNNYGSALQAYALHQKIKELGGEPVIIDSSKESKSIGLKQKILLFLRPEKHYGLIRKIRRSFEKRVYKDKIRKINDFIMANTKIVPFEECLKEMEQGGCVLLAGSDQVWNILNHPINGFYLFDYVHSDTVCKISYAASIGISELTKEQINYYKEVLAPFKVVSLREKIACDLLKNELTNTLVRQDVDPTLLHSAAFWEKLIPQRQVSVPFLFVYMLRPSNEVIEIARTIAKKNNLEIIYTGLYVNHYSGIKTIPDAGVEDFLYYIKNAEVIITNSFHGTVFSLLFEKRFASVRISSTSSRVENLLEIVKLQDHLIDNINDAAVAELYYDVEKVRRNLAFYREESIQYLRSIINS